MYSFVARQPIFDKNMATVGWELLFRDGLTNRFPDVSSEYATKQIISDLFFSTPLPSLVGKHACYINFPGEMIVQGFADALPHDKVVIEILETATPDNELLAAVRRLCASGFQIALDDFALKNEWERFFPYISIIKFDIQAQTFDEISGYITQNRNRLGKVTLLAEKVETQEEFDRYRAFGFDLFQGYFYSKPEVLQNKRLSQNKVLQIQLIAEVNAQNPDLAKIENYLKSDISLSYTLMRYTRNVVYNTRGIEIVKNSTLKDTLLYLGFNELRRFVSISCLTSIANVKTTELYHMSLVRGMFCELLAKAAGRESLSHDAFFCGLFSLLDVILGIALEDLVKQIALSERVTQALTDQEGVLYPFLEVARLYEQQRWEEVNAAAKSLGLSPEAVIEIMKRATTWADNIAF